MRQRKSDSLNFEVSELNLVPYMDIMVNLIIFMLFTMTGFIQMKVINVALPAIDTGEPQSASEPTPPPEKKLNIVMAIVDKKGIVVSLSGQFLLEDGSVVDQLPPGAFTLAAGTDGTFDYVRLQKVMEKAKEKDPTVTVLTIVPEKSVDYNTLIKVMDAIRYDSKEEDKRSLLYPDVTLGVG